MSEQKFDLQFKAIQNGDRKVFELLFKEIYPDLARYAYKITRDGIAAEEIVQEIFLYLWEKRSKINIQDSISAYLYSAVKNRCINWLRNELPKLQSTTDVTELEIQVSESGSPFDSERVKEIIEAAVRELPEKCREIFTLSRYAGLTYKEIAEELNISTKTVENQMNIAFKKLRTALKPLRKDF